MSAIIKFPLEKVQRTSSSRLKNNETAKILMFEGVQYRKEGCPEKTPVNTKQVTPVTAKP
ncbi:MAG: hypothetical protein AAGA76_04215 [Pseudomonadota bacterium]